MASHQTPAPRPAESAQRRVLLAAALFLLGCVLQWWRMQSLTASMDQGILMQVLWNGLRGHPFESTLSSQLSTNVIHSGDQHHLQHGQSPFPQQPYQGNP